MLIEIEPNTQVTAYKNIPIVAGQQLVFKDKTSQRAYFNSTAHFGKRYSNVTYIRKTGAVRLEDSMAAFGSYNYISWKNSSFENIEIYARVLDIEYINNLTVEFRYEIDWFQTFMHDLQYGNTVVEREQLSQGVYDKVRDKPHFYGKDEFQMISPEDLAVGRDLEKYNLSDELTAMPDTWGDPENYDTNALLSDLTVLMHIAPPSSSVTEEQSEMWFEIIKRFDGVNDGFRVGDLPTTLLTGWINIDTPDNYSFSDDGGIRLRFILDQLTLMGASSSIVGMYLVPKYISAITCNSYYTDGSGSIPVSNDRSERDGTTFMDEIGLIGAIDKPNYTEVHPKLNMFPFSYLRVTAPDGQEKEFKYEDFHVADDDPEHNYVDVAMFKYETSVYGPPSMSIIPQNYLNSTLMKRRGTLNPNTFNWLERIDYKTFPELPFTTDAYLTYLSTQYSSAYANQNALNDSLGIASDVLNIGRSAIGGATSGAILGSMGGPIGMAAGAVIGAGGSIVQGGASTSMNLLQRNMTIREANQVQKDHNRASESMYSSARQAFASSNYHPGSGSFLEYNFSRTMHFTAQPVQLKASILQRYSDYLWNYGTTTNRQGIPLIVNYMKNSSDVNKLPKFTEDSETGETFTYCKTNGVVVYSPLAVVSEYVADLFNTGCRFIKGD